MARSKKTKFRGETPLIEVGPENIKVIAKEVRIYRALVDERIIILKNEIKQKEKVKALTKEANLSRLQDGRIEFDVDNETVCLMPQDDLITIKKKNPPKKKKTKKDMQGKVKTEVLEFEGER